MILVTIVLSGSIFVSCKNDNTKDNVIKEETISQNNNSAKEVYRNPLTGEKCSKDESLMTPVAVMYSNIDQAMPQSSISYSDIVFESKVEGGITRMCCLFNNKTDLTKIGPVRSCRTYYLLFAKEFEAIYVHFGYSDYAKPYLEDSNMHSLDGMSTCDFYRSDDRVAPHNAYTSWKGIMESAKEKSYPLNLNSDFVSPLKFNTDDSKDISIKNGQKCTVFYPGYEYNNPWFEYDDNTKTYKRFQFNIPEMDAENNQQLSFKNILIKYVEPDYYPNNTPNYKIYGSGKGIFITDGYASNITWTKESEDSGPTKFYYSDGSEVQLNIGKTYIALVETTQNVNIKE